MQSDHLSKEFLDLLKLCGGEGDFGGMTIRDLFEKSFSPWFESYRNGDKSLDNNLSGMIENGLSEEEAFFILAYTGFSSRWINRELRDGNVPECNCKRVFIERLNKSLDKMKSFDNGLVFRMENSLREKQEVLNWFENKIGCRFRIPYFLSTSKEVDENPSLVWQIQTLKKNSFGKDISKLTSKEDELEVLFGSGSCFEIIGIDQKMEYVYLTEINFSSKIEFNLTGLYHRNIR